MKLLLIVTVLLAYATGVSAQTKSTADGIAEYRKMLEDGNPADLFEAKKKPCLKSVSVRSSTALDRTISRAHPATAKRVNASACRICPS